MGINRTLQQRIAARSLSDVDIPESSWKADFDIVDRYQSFANELMRISLLGIAGYGFLVQEIFMKRSELAPTLSQIKVLLCIGGLLLILSLVAVLAYRFTSTSCLQCQVQIMRSLKRLGNNHWTREEKETENRFLLDARNTQRISSTKSDYILKFSAVCFSLGFIVAILVFYKVLEAISLLG